MANTAAYPSGKAEDCKSFIPRFESGCRLHPLLFSPGRTPGFRSLSRQPAEHRCFYDMFPKCARVAELADARDLKSRGLYGPWGFDSPPGHQLFQVLTAVPSAAWGVKKADCEVNCEVGVLSEAIAMNDAAVCRRSWNRKL